jgi:hypothetical protein
MIIQMMSHHRKIRIHRGLKRKKHGKTKRKHVTYWNSYVKSAIKLYIIGNGFDLHHCIPSRYSDFKIWLEENDLETLCQMEEIFGSIEPEWWNEFETNLGNPFPVRQYAENVAFENQPDYASDTYRDRDLYAAEIEVENKLGGLINALKCDFQEWASLLPFGDGSLMLKLDKIDSLFLSFNYTLTLEKMYCISADRVKHIHGSLIDKESIVVGHGCDYSSFRSNLEDELPESPKDLPFEEYEEWYEDVVSQYSDDYPTSMAKDAAASVMSIMQKNVSSIIDKNMNFFHALKNVKKICIYGFSFAEVDLPYLLEVFKNVNIKTIELEVSYFTDNDKRKIETYCKQLNPKPAKVSLVKLADITKYKQLSLFD